MTKDEQIHFVITLCNNIRDGIIKDIENGKIPEEWDGIELRWLIAERSNCVISGTGNKGRKREYNNTVLVNNL